VVSIFADQDVGDGALGRKATLDQGRRGRSLFHTVGAGAAGILGTDGHDHTQLRRHDVQPLGTVFADLVHLPAAAGANEHLGLDDLLDPRQVRGQVATVAPGQPFAFRHVIARRLLISLRLAVSRISAATASRWSSGMAERSISGRADMSRTYPEPAGNAR